MVFMAPTRPLVAQQIEACYKIVGIPQSDTAEMTGTERLQPLLNSTFGIFCGAARGQIP